MDCFRYCSTPREKKCDENPVNEPVYDSNPINIDNDFFLCSHCYSKCVGNSRDSYTYNIFCSDKETFSHRQQKKYADDGSFLMFHIKVLFCLE